MWLAADGDRRGVDRRGLILKPDSGFFDVTLLALAVLSCFLFLRHRHPTGQPRRSVDDELLYTGGFMVDDDAFVGPFY